MREVGGGHGAAGASLRPDARPWPGRRRDLRRFWIQAGVLACIAAFLLFIARNVALNLDRLGISTGFGFLVRPAGFDIAQHLIDYSEQSSYLAVFIVALLNTVAVSAVAALLATVIGFAVGLARLSGNRLVSAVAAAYVETIRNVPLLLQLLFWYFAALPLLPPPRGSVDLFGLAFLNNRGLFIPAPVFGSGSAVLAAALAAGIVAAIALARMARRARLATGEASPLRRLVPVPAVLLPLAAGVAVGADVSWSIPVLSGFNFNGGLAIIPEFVAMTLGLSLYSAAFIAEIVRGGVASVARGQVEAALALGLSRWRTASQIVVPLAMRAIVPPLGAHYVVLLKNSSLAAAIAYPDLMLIFAGTSLNQTGQPIEIMIMTLSAYLALGLLIALATSVWNRRLALVEK